MQRREFIELAGGGIACVPLLARGANREETVRPIVPRRLRSGDTVALVNPAGATYNPEDLRLVRESLEALGLKSVEGDHVLDRYGYLAGRDEDRAEDINEMFDDSSVHALMAVRGGWGCNRLLPLLDYDGIARNPKILVGYSDITSLLVAIYARTGLVTFHGPVGTSTWNRFSVDCFRKVLMNAETPTFENPRTVGDNLAVTKDRIETVTPGIASGILIGGNLSVLTSMLGSPYLPVWKGAILFIEDDGEHIYRIDRMLTQLRLAGVLESIAGFIMGKCTNCGPGEGYGSLTLGEVLADHIKPLRIPAYAGAMIGHIENKFTVPVGIPARMDASRGMITLLQSAVA